jgi:serine/threonine protein kinase/WD40 repeat protein
MNDYSPIEAIFFAALEKGSPQERAAFLDEATAGNPVLRRRLEKMLAAQAEAGSFLEQPARASAMTVGEPLAETPGTRIGPYKLLQEIGEGGMGTVWMAEQQEPVRRRVALKVIKAGMDSVQVIARFEAERQALALMDHPNIAKVLDAGTTGADRSGSRQTSDVAAPGTLASSATGRPFFVMELVKGTPITKYCDEHTLTPRQRLELFVPVCQAIQHAHQKGIIHRDIKPSNVLVAPYDGKPVVKVIDFGVAKATGERLTERTLFTGFGAVVGTLEYMSPEQAELNNQDIDTRSDLYSLGVLLYELLTGTTPLERKRLKETPLLDVLRAIREEEPPKPSTRLSSSDTLPAIAAARQTEPAKLARLTRGELDWIVMKTLEKDRNRRYETASAFAADVQRYLNDEPVLACPPTLGYKVRKIVRRHRSAVLAISLVVLALVGGIIGTTWGMLSATDAQAYAVNEAKQKDDALADKEAALADAQDKLFLALVNRARAERASGRIGQRFETLEVIRQAARMRLTPELRAEAAAALVLPDAEIAEEWDGYPEDSVSLSFDAAFGRYARLDKKGGVTVCKLTDGKEEVITHLSPNAKAPVYGLWMSPDACFVACGHSVVREGVAGEVRVWKLGPKPAVLLDEPAGMNEWALAFHPSRPQLAIGHADKFVSVYDLATGRRVHHLAVSARPFHLAFHPRDGRLAVACDNVVQLFDTDTGKELPALRQAAPVTHIRSVAWHPDRRRLAAGCNDRKIHVWDTETATEVMHPWTGHTADGLLVAFSHAGDRLASVDWGGQTRLWDATNGRMLMMMPGNFGWQFSADDRLLGRGRNGTKIRLYRVAAGSELRVLRPRDADNLENVHSPVIHADGRTLSAAAGHRLCFFDLVSGEELASVKLPRPHAAVPVFFDPPHPPLSPGKKKVSGTFSAPFPGRNSPDSKAEKVPDTFFGAWLTGGYSGLLRWPARPDPARPEVLSIGPPKQLAPGLAHGFSLGASANVDGRIVAVPTGNSTVVLHRDRSDGRVLRRADLPQYDVRFSAVSPDGRWVVTCSHNGDGRSKTVWIWDADNGRKVHELPLGDSMSAKFSPDGRWLATFGNAVTWSGCRLWEVGTWREVRRFDAGGGVAFSPDSRLLAISDVLSVIRLIETATGREVARLTGPEPMWYPPACFTPDGTRLIASCSGLTALYVWDLPLIRQQLKQLGLDWEWDEFKLADPGPKAATEPKVEVLTHVKDQKK